MVKKKEKKIIVQTKKKDKPVLQRTVIPLLESPTEIWDDINRMYLEEPWMKPWWAHRMLNQPTDLFSEKRMKLIPIDLMDTGEGYQIIAELPGVNKKDIDVKVTSHTISICGETETTIRKDTEGYVRRERGYSSLCRYLRFPEDVNPDKAEAVLTDGILQVNVSKKTPTKREKRIPVK
jgi:HSP20 family protein